MPLLVRHLVQALESVHQPCPPQLLRREKTLFVDVPHPHLNIERRQPQRAVPLDLVYELFLLNAQQALHAKDHSSTTFPSATRQTLRTDS